MTADPWFIGVDIGGTFTDVVIAGESGSVHVRKVRTTPDDPVIGAVDGVRSALADARVDAGEVGRVVHGTTLATNLLLEGKGARVALATTAGFGDIIRIPRGGGAAAERAETLVSYVQPRSLVPASMTVEVPERTDAQGQVVIPLTGEAARRTARRLRTLHPESIAICLLHCYVNPAHEQLLAEVCQEICPGVPTYLSSDVSPAMREYGRAVTTAVSAYVGPVMADYLNRLQQELLELGIQGPIQIMESSGGVMPLELAALRAVRTVESGPAAGVISTQLLAESAGTGNLLSFDMGGTTAKCGVIRDGDADRKYEFYVGGVASWVGRHAGGFPIRIPVIDLAEVGAGGGSLAWIDEAGSLQVGPASAGADPGPACYGLGGDRPTVTDANLALGYLDAEHFAGGTVALFPDKAIDALTTQVAAPLGITVLEAAAAIHEMVTSSMAAAVRMMTIERGLDPRDFVLVSFGGSGPVHVARIARTFGIARIIVPAHAGVRSAIGLLGTDLSSDQVQSCLVATGDPAAAERVRETLRTLEQKAAREIGLEASPGLADTGAEANGIRVVRMADVRYRGQAHQIVVTMPPGYVDGAAMEALAGVFFERYHDLYGVKTPGPTEIVNCRLRLERVVPKWSDTASLQEGGDGPPSPGGTRPPRRRLAWFEELGPDPDEVLAYDWDALRAGEELVGPCVIDGRDSTLVVPPGFRVSPDDLGNLLMRDSV